MTEIRPISPADALWPECLKIYTESFPTDERREVSQLESIHGSQCYSFNIILKEGKLCGIIELWEFHEFIFLEHLAIRTEMQNKGVGSSALLNLLKCSDKPVLLEAELPYDEVSEKRIDFYKMKGFMVLNIDYTQPPYYPGKNSVPMLLLSNKSLSLETINYFIQTIKKTVYKMF